MSETQPVVITLSFLTAAPTDFEALDRFLDGVTERLELSLDSFLKTDPDVESFEGFSYLYLDDPEVNAGRCASCGRWTTDNDKPGALNELMIGWVVGGKLTCDECLIVAEAEAESITSEP